MSPNDEVFLLRHCKLWTELSEEQYGNLDVIKNYKKVRKGDYIYFEAFHHNYIYFIKKGHVLLGKIDDSGAIITKDILTAGDLLGQITLEKDNLNGEFARAIKSDVILCSFTVDKFLDLLKEHPSISLKYTKLIGLRVRKFENRLINILQRDARTRLLLFLGNLLIEKFKQTPIPDDIASIPNFLTHDEIAGLIGTSRQTVTTILNQFKNEKILEYSKNEMKFLNYKRNFTPVAI
jgi:CRP/FNR family transcriptional regulator